MRVECKCNASAMRVECECNASAMRVQCELNAKGKRVAGKRLLRNRACGAAGARKGGFGTAA